MIILQVLTSDFEILIFQMQARCRYHFVRTDSVLKSGSRKKGPRGKKMCWRKKLDFHPDLDEVLLLLALHARVLLRHALHLLLVDVQAAMRTRMREVEREMFGR